MTITAAPQWAEQDEAPEVLAVSDFNAGMGFFGYEASLGRDHKNRQEIVVSYDGEILTAFTEGEGDWLDELASYAYRLENGAMAA